MKMTNETKKIVKMIALSCFSNLCGFQSWSAHTPESVYIETKEVAPIDEVKVVLLQNLYVQSFKDDVAH